MFRVGQTDCCMLAESAILRCRHLRQTSTYSRPMMPRYSSLWWASILLSSVVTGGGSFALLSLFTELPIETTVAISLALVLAGDLLLAKFWEAVSPTRVTLGPGDRRTKTDLPRELGMVIDDFEDGQGSVAIRGERWRARQATGCDRQLRSEETVRVLERDGLALVVAHPESTHYIRHK